jgi:hypothetical protein
MHKNRFKQAYPGFLLLPLLAIAAVGLFCPIQVASSPRPENPEDVVRRLCEADASGSRLAPAGWYAVDSVFLRPEVFSSNVNLVVKEGDCASISSETKGNRATVGIEYLMVGQLDPSMRFSRPGEATGPIKLRSFYTLVLTDTYWIRTTDSNREAHGPNKWKIVKFQSQQVVSVATAIRYIRQVREQTKDPAVRANADRSLSILGRYQR